MGEFDDVDPWRVYSVVVIKKCKKDHRCVCCETTTPKGCSYTTLKYVLDGKFHDEKFCTLCWVANTSFSLEHGFECLDAEQFKERLAESAWEGHADHIHMNAEIQFRGRVSWR